MKVKGKAYGLAALGGTKKHAGTSGTKAAASKTKKGSKKGY
jgi:hypothetical protein